MADIKKTIAGVTINYEDGTQDKLEYYALVGFGANTWFKLIESPPQRDSKIKMNNQIVELSNSLIESIGM